MEVEYVVVAWPVFSPLSMLTPNNTTMELYLRLHGAIQKSESYCHQYPNGLAVALTCL